MGAYKIGDRVRLIKDGKSTTGAVGKLATIDSWDGQVMSGEDYLLKIDPPYDYKTLSVSPEYTRATEDCFVAVADSNSNDGDLRIEAGKYYRTRDGRKVGPMYGKYGVWTDGKDAYCFDNGRVNYDGESGADLIAEWVDDPVDLKGIAKDVTKLYGWFTNTTPAIVARIDNGQPRPATRPYVHPNRASAEKEAARLAKANPGREFGVYEFVSSTKEERKYEHEWQRAAKEGREYDAACLLQDVAGTSFHGAQAAVKHWLEIAA